MDVTLRAATPSDASAVAEVYLASRKAFLPFAPLVHTDDEVRKWIAGVLARSSHVVVAVADASIIGMMALSRGEDSGWLDQLYLHPAAVGRGIGTRLLEHAKRELGPPISLHTFQANAGARRFYERHGFTALAFGDGLANEEKCPDVLYEWRFP
jgi:GNAT superfamily N-acetyltransferase